MARHGASEWLDWLDEEDRSFIKRFVLASGSLKEMARIYGVSYPTVRLRLDRLIAKIEALDDRSAATDFERLVRALYAEGTLEIDTMRALLEAHAKDLEERDGPHPESPETGDEADTSPASARERF